MKKFLLSLALVLLSVFALVGCTKTTKAKGEGEFDGLTGTALAVAKASKMTLEELKAASKKEMEESNTPFVVVGLTSVLGKAATAIANQYDWLHADGDNKNIQVKSDYKDYSLLTALQEAENGFVADYALVQDERSMADYAKAGLLHNYIPSDWQALGLTEADTKKPLKGIHFNKLFYTNTNFQNATGKTLHNIWQLAGTSADADHLSKVSFQSPSTEMINMSFLLSCYAEENQARIKTAYKNYYGKDWEPSTYKIDKMEYTYKSAGEQWVREFVSNISRLHGSDGTAMKATQVSEADWNAGYVYYGAFAKMKDAVSKTGSVDINNDGTKETVNAMTTVKWDWEIDGFNGFMYTMDSQIVNNAQHPYTACLYARTLLELSTYEKCVYNNTLPGKDDTVDYTWNTSANPLPENHGKVNQYGYYFPGSNKITYAKNDWTRDVHMAKEIVENYDFLKTVKGAQVNAINTLVGSLNVEK